MSDKETPDEIALWFITTYTQLSVDGNAHRALVSAIRSQLAAAEEERTRLRAALSNLIHDACGGEVIIPAGSLADARPLQWYADNSGEITIMCEYL